MKKLKSNMKFFSIIITSIIFYFFLGCNKKNDSPNSIPQPVYYPPSQFVITVGSISSDSALITWSEAISPNKDSIKYNIFLNDTLILSNYLRLNYTFKNLRELTSYNVKIVAVDTKQNKTSAISSFITTKYWLKFLKKVSFGQITGYSNQKNGQMVKGNDGGYIIVGESQLSDAPNGIYKMFTIKIDSLGNKVWQKFYDYFVNGNEIKIQNCADGYVLCGGVNLLKINNYGDLIWLKKTSSLYELIRGFCINNAGQIYTAGEISFDSTANLFTGVIKKYESDGTLLWTKKISRSFYDQFYDIKLGSDGQLIVLGLTMGTNITRAEYVQGAISRVDYWILKLNLNAEIIWNNVYNNMLGYAFPKQIIQTKEGNYVFTGFNFGSRDIPYFYLQMIDPNGKNIWNYSANDNTTRATFVTETNDNNLIVTGGFQITYGSEFALYKFDKKGNKMWEKLYYEFPAYIMCNTVIPTSDGGYIINAQKSKTYNTPPETNEIYIFKTDDLGNFN